MSAVKTIVELSALSEFIGDRAPTFEEWSKLKAKIEEGIGEVVANKIFEEAEKMARYARDQKDAQVQQAQIAGMQVLAQARTAQALLRVSNTTGH